MDESQNHEPNTQVETVSNAYVAPDQILTYSINSAVTPIDVKTALKASFYQRLGALARNFLTTLELLFMSSFIIGVFVSNILYQHDYNYDFTGLILLIEIPTISILALIDTVGIGSGQTRGDRLAKIRYVTASGQKPGYIRGFFRWLLLSIFFLLFFSGVDEILSHLVYLPSTTTLVLDFAKTLPLIIGRLWFLWDKDGQTLFDKIVGVYPLDVR